MEKYYLNVRYDEKDIAKSLGAKWDPYVKKWYYTNYNDTNKFERWLLQPSLTYASLSSEQQRLIDLALTGNNILVDACIGSGKTTTIQVLCNEMRTKSILYLTYNKLLKIDAQSKIIEKNTYVQNYHGFAYKFLKDAKISSSSSDVIQLFNRYKPQIPHYDVLIIDEYQDIELEISIMLEYIKKCNPFIQIIAVGDMQQKIYDKTILDVEKFIGKFLTDFISLKFTKCFRLCDDYAKDLGYIWGKEIKGVNTKSKIQEMTPSQVLKFLAVQNPADILCLGARNGIMSWVLNELESNYSNVYNKKTVYASISDDDKGNIQPDKNTAIFTTFDSSKGLERKICVVFDYTEEYWEMRINKPFTKHEILRNIFCVAASRGKDLIIFVKGKEDTKLSKETLVDIGFLTEKIAQNYNVSDMFDFKYKEDIEKSMSLLNIEPIKIKDRTNIEIKNNDCLIDLSPCIGIYQEAYFFDNYDIDTDIKFLETIAPNKYSSQLKNDLTLDEKILYLTACETSQKRYFTQVKLPFVNKVQARAINKRLETVFNHDEDIQIHGQLQFEDSEKHRYTINGIADVVKDDTVYELKFVSELKHGHFLQCACYMLMLNLDKGILWNTRNNEMYKITIPNKRNFLNAVIQTITKSNREFNLQCNF